MTQFLLLVCIDDSAVLESVKRVSPTQGLQDQAFTSFWGGPLLYKLTS